MTLHALGGAGKSRLAFALAGQVAARFALGATWVALGAVQSAQHLPSAIGRALGFELAARAAPGAALCDALRSQERLLVLDNFEHLVESGGAELVVSILREAPRVRLLVTSREVLGLQEEWVYEVPGLAFPAAAMAQAPGPGEFPAVELFLQRARQAYLGFSAQAEWPHVVRICRLVEGLPLAIELAAACERAGFAPGRYAALDTLGQALRRLGRFDEARELFEQALAHGPPTVASDARFNLGSMQLEQGQLGAAALAALQLLDTALSRGSASVQRLATLLAAAIAVRDPRWLDAAQGWLSALIADRDLDFDRRREALALLALAPAHGASKAGASATDIVAQLRKFLNRDV